MQKKFICMLDKHIYIYVNIIYQVIIFQIYILYLVYIIFNIVKQINFYIIIIHFITILINNNNKDTSIKFDKKYRFYSIFLNTF